MGNYPETRVTDGDGSCDWPNLNVETEITDASRELGCGSGWVMAGEVIGTEILVAGAVGEHVVGGG